MSALDQAAAAVSHAVDQLKTAQAASNDQTDIAAMSAVIDTLQNFTNGALAYMAQAQVDAASAATVLQQCQTQGHLGGSDVNAAGINTVFAALGLSVPAHILGTPIDVTPAVEVIKKLQSGSGSTGASTGEVVGAGLAGLAIGAIGGVMAGRKMKR